MFFLTKQHILTPRISSILYIFLLKLLQLSVTASTNIFMSMSLATMTKPRILCLHGRCQSGSIFSNKISGARRKLSRQYELVFLDGPLSLETEDISGENSSFAWWKRDEPSGRHLMIEEAIEYVENFAKGQSFDAIIGFSQGGTLATALALSGTIPGIKAVVTAGSPMVEDAMNLSSKISCDIESGKNIPKIHFAGETDTMVPVESVERLCDSGGNGQLYLHEKGHLFPTKALYVNYIMDFLQQNLL